MQRYGTMLFLAFCLNDISCFTHYVTSVLPFKKKKKKKKTKLRVDLSRLFSRFTFAVVLSVYPMLFVIRYRHDLSSTLCALLFAELIKFLFNCTRLHIREYNYFSNLEYLGWIYDFNTCNLIGIGKKLPWKKGRMKKWLKNFGLLKYMIVGTKLKQ